MSQKKGKRGKLDENDIDEEEEEEEELLDDGLVEYLKLELKQHADEVYDGEVNFDDDAVAAVAEGVREYMKEVFKVAQTLAGSGNEVTAEHIEQAEQEILQLHGERKKEGMASSPAKKKTKKEETKKTAKKEEAKKKEDTKKGKGKKK